MAETARELGLVPSTVHRWLNDGFIHGEQLTPGAPWRIRLTGDIRALLVDNTPDGWLATLEATHAYGLSRQTLLQRVKRGEIRAVYLRTGRKKGLRIDLQPGKQGCSNRQNSAKEQCDHEGSPRYPRYCGVDRLQITCPPPQRKPFRGYGERHPKTGLDNRR